MLKKRIAASVIALLMAASSLPMVELSQLVPDLSITASAAEQITVDGFDIQYSTVTENDMITGNKIEYLKVTVPPEYFANKGGANSDITIDTTRIKQAIRDDAKRVILDCQFSKSANMKDLIAHVTFSPDDTFVTKLGANMFMGCKNLQTVTLNGTITEIGSSAFGGCQYFAGSSDNNDNKFTMTNIKVIDASAFSGCSTLAGFSCPNAEAIGANAFSQCEKMTEVNIPSCIKFIGDGAFQNNASLRSVSFPEKVEMNMLGKSLFSGCKALQTVSSGSKSGNTLPDGIMEVGTGFFTGCTSLQSFNVNNSLTYIADNMFSSCTSLRSVSFDKKSECTWIGTSAFSRCTAMNSIALPQKVTGIAGSAFAGCENLSRCIVPDGLEYLSGIKNPDYKNIKDTEGTPPYICINNYEMDSAGSAFTGCNVLSLAPLSSADKVKANQVIIPKGVRYIPKNTFASCAGITDVQLGNTADIGDNAFSKCVSLAKIDIPDALSIIRKEVFAGCEKLAEVVLPKELITIQASAFSGCKVLNCAYPHGAQRLDNTIVFPSSLGAVLDNSFKGCSKFRYLNILDVENSDLAIMGDSAFSDCSSLKGSTSDGKTAEEIVFPNKVVVIEKTLFKNCSALENVVFRGNVTSIGDNAFENCSALANVTMNDTLTQIGKSAFINCAKLANVPVTPQGKCALTQVDDIKDSTFAGCTSLKTVDISEAKKLKAIDNNAFKDCTSLEKFYVPASGALTSVGSSAFSGCTALELFTSSKSAGRSVFPDTITSIGTSAFESTSLTDIYIKAPADTSAYNVIESGAFASCEKLRNADLSGANMSEIKANTFSGDIALKTVKLPQTLTTISAGAFSNCNSLSTINSSTKGEAKLPSSLKTIGPGAFTNNHNIASVIIPSSADNINTNAWDSNVKYTQEDIDSGKAYPLKEFVVGSGNAKFMSDSGVLYNKDGSELIIYPVRKDNESFAVPATVRTVMQNGFKNNELIKYLTVNDGLEKFSSNAVSGCTNLRSVSFPKNKDVVFDGSSAVAGGSAGLRLVFYAPLNSTAQTYANKSSTILFVEYDKMVKDLSFKEGEKKTVVVEDGAFTLTPVLKDKYGNDTIDELEWKVSDTSVLRLEKGGKITPLKSGKADVTITAANGISATITITVVESDVIPVYQGTVSANGITAAFATKYDNEGHYYLTFKPTGSFYTGTTSIVINTEPIRQALDDKLKELSKGKVDLSTCDYVESTASFTNNKNIANVEFSRDDKLVSRLGPSMFSGCINLQTVTFNDTINSIGDKIFSGCINFVGSRSNNTVRLENITRIGESAFEKCETLAGVKLSSDLESIASKTFTGCKKLLEIQIPKSVTYIGGSAFAEDTALAKVTFEEGSKLKTLGDNAFYNCAVLKSVNVGAKENTLPEQVEETGVSVFQNCKSLPSFNINKALTYVAGSMFSGCTSLKTVAFEDGSVCNWIGPSAFSGCTSMNEIELPEYVKGICTKAFSGCEKLSKCIVPDGFEFLDGAGNVDYKDIETTPGAEPYIGISEFTGSGGSAFAGCKVLSLAQKSREAELKPNQILIPELVTYIPIGTFSNCENITDVQMPQILDIGSSAFSECSALPRVEVPDAVKIIRPRVFNKCSSLKDVIYSKDLFEVGSSSFADCFKLTTATPSDEDVIPSTIQFPKSFGIVRSGAFSNCRSFKYMNILGGEQSDFAIMEGSAFSGCSSLEGSTVDGTSSQELKFPKGVVVIQSNVFNNCSSLKKIRFAGNVTSIGDSSFYNCSALTNVTMNPTIAQIGRSAFFNCASLVDVPMTPEGTTALVQLEDIKDSVFANCRSIKNVDITTAKNISAIGNSAFSSCTSLKQVLVAEDGAIASIGSSAFNGCTELELFTSSPESEKSVFPDSIAVIGSSAFNNTSLKDIVITAPASAAAYNVIDPNAFSNCTKLKTADLSTANMTEVKSSTFSGDKALETVTLPQTVTTISSNAFSECNSLSSINSTVKGEANLPEKLKTIGSTAFSNNHNISKVIIPDSADIISTNAWNSNVKYTQTDIDKGKYDPLREFVVGENNANYMSKDGVLYNKDGSELVIYPVRKQDESFTVPDGVEEIRSNAFTGTDLLKYVNVGNDLAKLNANAFNRCAGLRSVNFGSNANVVFDKAAFSSLSSAHKLVFYGPEESTAQQYADKNSSILFVENGKMVDEIKITQGDKITAVKENGQFKLNAELYDKNGELTQDVLVWESDDLDVITVDNNGSVTPKGNGTAHITITAANDVSKTIEVTIGIKDISDADVTFDSDTFAYDGTAKKPKITVTDLSKQLTENRHYEVTMTDNVNVGTVTVTIKGVGSYTGETTRTFEITGRSLEDASAELIKKQYNYTGSEITPLVAVTYKNTKLTENVDYTLECENNVNVGTATVTVKGKGNYAQTITQTFEIVKCPAQELDIVITPESVEYDGNAKTPDVKVMHGERELEKGKEYTVAFEDNINAGEATVTVTGAGNYTGTISQSFTIEPRDINKTTVKFDKQTFVYDGSEKYPTVKVTDGKKTLAEGTDYYISYNDNTYAGETTVTISGMGNYADSKDVSFTIAPKSIENVEIESEEAEYSYDGTEKTPGVLNVIDGPYYLEEGIDYTVSYENNTAAGTAYIVITGMGNYNMSAKKPFTIKGIDLGSAQIKLNTTSFVYDGTEKKPSATVKYNGKTLKAGTDYKIEYTGNIDAGKATATVTGIGSYSGSKKLTFSISQLYQRFAGAGRYATAAEISKGAFEEKADTVVLAYGLNYADALAGVPLAKQLDAPILLTNTKALPDETMAEIKRLGAKKVILLGGTGAIGDEVRKKLEKEGLKTERIAGASRFGTATAIAQAMEKDSREAPKEVFFVNAFGFADALSASTAAAAKGAPIIYLKANGDIDDDTAEYLKTLKSKGTVTKAYAIGGVGVISNEMMKKAANALGLKTAERIAGANRYSTCVAVNNRFSDILTGSSVCVAKGMDFPDALAGGVFAAKNLSPLFLADGQLNDEQKEYLKGKKKNAVYVFGGTGAVPEKLARQIADT